MITLHRIEEGQPCSFRISGPEATITVVGDCKVLSEIFLGLSVGRASIIQEWLREGVADMTEDELRGEFTKNGWTISLPENSSGQ